MRGSDMSGGIFVFCETKDGGFRRVCGELLTQFRNVADAGQQALCAIVVGEPVADELPQLSEWARRQGLPRHQPAAFGCAGGAGCRPDGLRQGRGALAARLRQHASGASSRSQGRRGSGAPRSSATPSPWNAGMTGFTSCAPSTAASSSAGSVSASDSPAVITFRPNALGFAEVQAERARRGGRRGRARYRPAHLHGGRDGGQDGRPRQPPGGGDHRLRWSRPRRRSRASP